MAKRIGKGSGPKGSGKKGTKKMAGGTATVATGHNSVNKKAIKEFFARLDRVHDEKEQANSGFMSDIKELFEEAASVTGFKRKVFRMLYQEHRHQTKLSNVLANFDANERDDADRLMAAGTAFGENSPFGRWCIAQGDSSGDAEDSAQNEPGADEFEQAAST